ncbi:hypothetical protein ACLKMH_17930 [Psychromonas sp. KJ10-10]|uniref:hypothetical protein n=1 Tax=Psychromonas sp. KJ10-10 TaxID=3391823 RepID=UPI0039B37B5E
MSTIDTLNTVQQQLAKVTTGTSSSSTLSGEAFSKALDFAMDSKDLVLPTPVNAALDLGIEALDINSLLSTDSSSIQEGIEDVFSDLSVGIATSFVSALSGADSATEVTADTTETTDSKTTSATTATEDGEVVTAKNVSTVKKVIDGVVPLVTDNKAVPLASSLLSTLEGTLLDDEEDEEKS